LSIETLGYGYGYLSLPQLNPNCHCIYFPYLSLCSFPTFPYLPSTNIPLPDSGLEQGWCE